MTIGVTAWKHSIGIPAGRGRRSLFVPVLKCQALELRPFFGMLLLSPAPQANHQTVWSFGHWSLGDYFLWCCGVRG